MSGRDPYQVLGVSRNASTKEINKAYKRLARQYHPDVNAGDEAAEERFKAISEAYNLLSEPARRQVYDQGGAGNGFAAGQDAHFSGSFSGGLGDLFAQMFGAKAGTASPPGPAAGPDIEAALRLGFMDAIRGLTTSLRIQRQAACTSCAGTGSRPDSQPQTCAACSGSGRVGGRRGLFAVHSACPRCSGAGRWRPRDCAACSGRGTTMRSETIQVRVPPGVRHGTRLRLAGRGHAGNAGGSSGDLYVRVQVESHPVFIRHGDAIHCSIPVTVTEAALGARIQVPTVDGVAMLTVPPGSRSGQQMRLKGKGAPARRGGRGDAMVTLQVITPSAENPEVEHLLRQLAHHLPEAGREELLRKAGP